MKIFLLLCCIVFLAATSFAAFPVKSTHTLAGKTLNLEIGCRTKSNNYNFPNEYDRSPTVTHRPLHPDGKKGPYGTWSLIFGVASIALVWMGGGLLAIPAIILGLEGKKHNEKYSNTGYILGQIGGIMTIVAVVVALLVLLLFVLGTGI